MSGLSRCLKVRTREEQSFLVFNGIQTQSAKVYNLITELPLMQTLQIDVLRISPQSEHTGDIVRLFRNVLDGKLSGADGLREMESLMPDNPCNGYWHGKSGMEWH